MSIPRRDRRRAAAQSAARPHAPAAAPPSVQPLAVALLAILVATSVALLVLGPRALRAQQNADVARARAADPGDAPLRRRAWWRARIAPPTADSGAVVASVEAGAPAARAGLRAGDRIVRLGDLAVAGRAAPTNDLPGAWWPAFRAVRGGDRVRLRVARPRAAGGAVDTVDVAFVVDSLPHERIAGARVSYGALRSDRGHRLRTIVTRPERAAADRLPGILFVQWLSCSSVESPLPTQNGFSRLLADVAGQSGMVMLRVEKPGLGDSEGPDCSRGDLEDELAGYRAGLRALRALPDVDTTRLLVVGGSIGGALAPILAAESPAGIRGVAAIGGYGRTWYEHMLDIERRRLTLAGRAPAEVNAAMRQVARFYAEYLLERRTPGEVLAAHPELRAVWDDEPARQYGRPAAYYHQAQALDPEGAWAALAARGVAGLVVWGEYDWIMGRAEQERVVDVLSGVRPGLGTFVTLPRTSHDLNVFPDMAAAFADREVVYDGAASRAVLRWLGDVGRSRGFP